MCVVRHVCRPLTGELMTTTWSALKHDGHECLIPYITLLNTYIVMRYASYQPSHGITVDGNSVYMIIGETLWACMCFCMYCSMKGRMMCMMMVLSLIKLTQPGRIGFGMNGLVKTTCINVNTLVLSNLIIWSGLSTCMCVRTF